MGEQFIALEDATVWHQILAALSLEDKFKITLHGKNRVVVQLRGDSTLSDGDPCTQLLWNVNGLASRWINDEKSASVENFTTSSAKKIKKRNQFARKQEKANFRSIILKAGTPDLVTLIESKISLNKLLSLNGFINWCENMKYQFITISYSSSEIKGGAGYAGVVTLSKYQPILTTFDFAELPTDEARVITHEFNSFVHVSIYSPCTGYDPIKMNSRLKFDSDLAVHLKEQQMKTGKPLICSGDLNINPRRQDWNEKAFVSLYKLRESSGNIHHPGCSPQELSSYANLLHEAKISNAWEELYPYSTEGMTWHPPTDPHGENCWGQRLDHFLISPQLLSTTWKYHLDSMINLRGEGSSDHNPLLLNMKLTSASPSVFALNAGNNTDIMICNLDTNKTKLFKAAECPRISIEVCDTWTQIFIDTGAPFSIYNPPAIRNNGDNYLAKSFPTGNQTNCSFTGATGGRIRAEQNYVMSFKVGTRTLQGCFVVLTKHETNLPLFLFGQDLLMGPLEELRL